MIVFRKIQITTLLLFVFLILAKGQDIIPNPVQLIKGIPGNSFDLGPNTKVIIRENKDIQPTAEYLLQYLAKYYNIHLPILNRHTKIEETQDSYIHLTLDQKLASVVGSYQLEISKNQIEISSATPEGLFYGIQTLIQILPVSPIEKSAITLPALKIYDYPRFQYRGMHLDVSRHFFDVEFIKKYIDYLALHKINYFHWHLTDDQGWRIEIKKYPKLTTISSWRKGTIIGLFPGKGNENIKYQVLPDQIKITPANHVIKTDNKVYGGFYTQEEIKEVVAYAASRFITIIPEIEMPAHSRAVLAAYPELGTEAQISIEVATTWGMFNKYNNVFQVQDKTFQFLEGVLDEVIELFPSKFIHIGGDEAAKVWWKKSSATQQFMKSNGIPNEVALQSYFVQRVEKYLNNKGKTIIGWDEVLDGGLAPNTIVMSWRGEKGGIAAAQQNHPVIMTPENILYFNHNQFLQEDSLTVKKYNPLEAVYNYDPVPSILTAEQQKFIWGAQANLWTEYIPNPQKVEYMIFPRIAALSEITWSQNSNKSYTDFLNRLKTQFKRYKLWGINYSKKYEKN
ncbi:MAG: beta-N-acetylhexosaminidase [Pedobacter sp.]|nr:MAG: beta-N-acetylhexosaminidase [Pedobacter sp.]